MFLTSYITVVLGVMQISLIRHSILPAAHFSTLVCPLCPLPSPPMAGGELPSLIIGWGGKEVGGGGGTYCQPLPHPLPWGIVHRIRLERDPLNQEANQVLENIVQGRALCRDLHEEKHHREDRYCKPHPSDRNTLMRLHYNLWGETEVSGEKGECCLNTEEVKHPLSTHFAQISEKCWGELTFAFNLMT